MTDEILFNCCTGNRPPDWSQFDGLEVGGCITFKDEASGREITEGGIGDDKAEFWTVYGHLKTGGVEAITDCATRTLVDSVALMLRAISGLSITA
jgi:hypothetical protein